MKKIFYIIIIFLIVFNAKSLYAEPISIDANTLIPKVNLFVSPSTGSFVEDSIFDVTITLNTKSLSVNGVDVKVNFDPSKLAVVKPSGGKSIIGVWVEPPSFDNSKGVVSYVGVIPNGVITGSGVIGTITFKVLRSGRTNVKLSSNSFIYLNDGLGTKASVDFGIGQYDLVTKAPEGVRIYSETHPLQSNWYNNNSPVFSWERDLGVTGFSFILDDKPTTIPDNQIDTNDTVKSFEKLSDGLNYFHIKSFKNGVWSGTGHFLVRIDTSPPADFKPTVNYLVSEKSLGQRALVSFFTTDSLSGIDKYEIGVISLGNNTAPVFIESESPFQIENKNNESQNVVVRVFDKAGNIRDVSISIKKPFILVSFVKEYLVYILSFIIILSILMFLFHYLVGHKILSHIRRAFQIVEQEEKMELLQEARKDDVNNIQSNKDNNIL